MRKGFLVSAAVGLLVAAALGASAGSAAQSNSVRVQVPATSQSSLLSTGKLRARVHADVPGRVKVAPRVQPNGSPPVRIGKPRRVRFDEPGSRMVRLPLSAAGRTLFQDCKPKNLVVSARLKTTGAQAAGKAARAVATVPLAIDGPCGSTGVVTVPGAGGGGGGSGGGGGGGGGCAPNCNVIPAPQPYTGPAIDTTATTTRGCDFLVPDDYDATASPTHSAVCLQPWPNDYFTQTDSASDTGRRVNLNVLAMPQTQPGGVVPAKPIEPDEFNRNDGFSPGNMLIVRVPGLDNRQAFDNTGLVPIDDPAAYADADQPVVVINADTGERHPVWAEIDSNPSDRRGADNAEARSLTNLLIRPLVNFEEGGRYVVALRNLKDESNAPIDPSDAFRVYRDNLTTGDPLIEERRPHMEDLFETLGQAGIQRSNLYLAWDFTVASERNLSERMLHIRDEAFDALGDTNLANGTVQGNSPTFQDIVAQDFTPAQNGRIARRVTGTVTVPCFMNNGCQANGGTFNYTAPPTDPDRLPAQNGTVDVAFRCEIPRAAIDDPNSNPARPSLYGHGLLGSANEVGGGNVTAMANEHNMIMCATDWYGFATQNAANILAILQDLSRFPLLVDGSQQGFLNFLYLGRALIHPQGLVSDPAFQGADGNDLGTDPDPLIDTTRLFYDGNSQGGILGGGLTAFAPDFRRAVLGVPGMNYSTLLRRSVDFEPYAEGQFEEIFEEAICDQAGEIPNPDLAMLMAGLCATAIPADTTLGLYDNYPNELERPVILSLIQMLWDRGEANGYAHHMTDDPLADTPSHAVLLHAAFGDHQVANVTAEVEARTIGASVYQPALDPGRHWEADGSNPIWGIPSISSFPFGGSALVYWDGGPLGFDDPFDADTDNDGTATPPNENIPPRPPEFGADPHSYPRADVKGRAQKSAFLGMNGRLRNPCTTTNRLVSPPMPIAFETGTAIPCYANGYLGP